MLIKYEEEEKKEEVEIIEDEWAEHELRWLHSPIHISINTPTFRF